MKLCTRSLCHSTAVAFPRLSFRDAAENQSSALLRLAACAEHQGSTLVAELLGVVNVEAVKEAHSKRYGLVPILSETTLSWVAIDSIEGQTYLAALEGADNKAELFRQLQPKPGVISLEEVSQEEFDRLLAISRGEVS